MSTIKGDLSGFKADYSSCRFTNNLGTNFSQWRCSIVPDIIVSQRRESTLWYVLYRTTSTKGRSLKSGPSIMQCKGILKGRFVQGKSIAILAEGRKLTN